MAVSGPVPCFDEKKFFYPRWKAGQECSFLKVPVRYKAGRAEALDRAAASLSSRMTRARRERGEDDLSAYERAIWGFLSACAHGTADTFFKMADKFSLWKPFLRISSATCSSLAAPAQEYLMTSSK